MTETITVTFGECAENHVGMQKIGTIADKGFTIEDLKDYQEIFECLGSETELINLEYSTEAAVLVIRDCDGLLYDSKFTTDDLFEEQKELNWDSKAKMYGRVVNKHARHNICYSDRDQEPDYENGVGRVVAWKRVPRLNEIRKGVMCILGKKGKDLKAEGNRYYDVRKCGIGFHGDSERKKVVALRLGAEMSLHFQWFLGKKPVGERVVVTLGHGDMYIMSEKATGFDWKRSSIPTLRHAAGCEKYTRV